MSLSATIRAMRATGLSDSQILEIVEKLDDQRRAKAAAKKRRQRSSFVPDVPGTCGTLGDIDAICPRDMRDMSSPPASPSSFPPTPPLITTPSPTPPSTLGERAREADFRAAISALYAQHGYLPPETGTAVVWLKQGRDPEICLAVIGDLLARKGQSLPLKYFYGPIADAHAAPPQARAAPARPPPARRDGWAEMYRKLNGLGEFADDRKAPHDGFDGVTIDARAAFARAGS